MGKKNRSKSKTPQNSPSVVQNNSKVGKIKQSTVSQAKKSAIKNNFEKVKELGSTTTTLSKKSLKKNKTKTKLCDSFTQTSPINGSSPETKISNTNKKNKDIKVLSPDLASADDKTPKPLSKRAKKKLAKLKKQGHNDFIPLSSPAVQPAKGNKKSPPKGNSVKSPVELGQTNLFDSGSDDDSDVSTDKTPTIVKKTKPLLKADSDSGEDESIYKSAESEESDEEQVNLKKSPSANVVSKDKQKSSSPKAKKNLNEKSKSPVKGPNILDFGSDDDDDEDDDDDDDDDEEDVDEEEESEDASSDESEVEGLNTNKKSTNSSLQSFLSLDTSNQSLSSQSPVKAPRKRKVNDDSDESGNEGKDFIDDEAEEGEETNEDESSESEEETVSQSLKKQKKFTPQESKVNPTDKESDENEEEVSSPAKRQKFSPKDPSNTRRSGENKVFISGLAPTTKASELRATLSSAGEIVDIHVPTDRDEPMKCRGFAFVTYANEEAVQKALELSDNLEIDGQPIFIRKYKEEGREGGRGGGGRGRGGGFHGGRGGGFRGGRGGGGGFRGGRGGFDRDGGNRGRGGFRGGRGRGNFRGGRGGFNKERGQGKRYFS